MPRNVVFIAPFPTDVTTRFLRAAAKLDDVNLLGVVHTAPSGTDLGVFHDFVRVTDPLNLQDLFDGVEVLRRRHGRPYRILGILEAMMIQLAALRERFGVQGTSVHTATLFRDKARMKDALRAAGLPVARHKLITSARDAQSFAEEVGYPMVLKPPAGMGAKATSRVNTLEEILMCLRDLRAGESSPVLAEEMLRGREHSFETITVGREPRAWSVSNYSPACLEVLENPWIQWACVLPREVETQVFERARDTGFAAVRALGLEDGMTHMEWFEKPDGTLAIGEIAQRPPGPQLLQMTGLVHDIDPYRAWARAEVDSALDAPWERKYAAGCAYVRGLGHGRIRRVTGVRETHEAVGPWLVEAKLPALGAPKNESYEGDGYVIVRHESTEKVEEMIKTIVETLKVHYTNPRPAPG